MDAFYDAVNTTTDETLDKLNKRRAKKPISMEEATDFIEAENAKLLEEDISIKDKVPKSYAELAEAASNLGTIQDLVNGKFADGTQLSEE